MCDNSLHLAHNNKYAFTAITHNLIRWATPFLRCLESYMHINILIFKGVIQARPSHSEHSSLQNLGLRSCVWLSYSTNTTVHDSKHKNEHWQHVKANICMATVHFRQKPWINYKTDLIWVHKHLAKVHIYTFTKWIECQRYKFVHH